MKLSIFLFFSLICSCAIAQTIQEFVIQGNKKTKSSYIHMLVELRIGQQVDSVLMERDMVRLIRETGIAHAYYQVSNDGLTTKVVYGVEENFTIIPSFNFFTTDQDEVAYRIGVAEFNGLGRGLGVGILYQRDIFDSYAINFRAPALFNRKLGLFASYQNLTTEEPVFFDNTTANYKYNNRSVELTGLYQFNLKHRVEAGFSLFKEDYQYIEGATNPVVPLALVADKSLLKGIYEYDNVKVYYQYFSGWRSNFNLQYVHSTSIDLPDFVIWRNDLTYFKRLGERGNWASRLRVGFATNDDTPFAPFAVDNNLNIRGVGNIIDRGTGVVVLNTEYRRTLIDKGWFVLQGNAFVDAGTWRNPAGDLSDLYNQENVRVYPGLGFRLMHKRIFNAVLRVDYGVGITPGGTRGLVFGIGQYF